MMALVSSGMHRQDESDSDSDSSSEESSFSYYTIEALSTIDEERTQDILDELSRMGSVSGRSPTHSGHRRGRRLPVPSDRPGDRYAIPHSRSLSPSKGLPFDTINCTNIDGSYRTLEGDMDYGEFESSGHDRFEAMGKKERRNSGSLRLDPPLRRSILVSAQTGEEVLEQSDDEFTYETYHTGDDDLDFSERSLGNSAFRLLAEEMDDMIENSGSLTSISRKLRRKSSHSMEEALSLFSIDEIDGIDSDGSEPNQAADNEMMAEMLDRQVVQTTISPNAKSLNNESDPTSHDERRMRFKVTRQEVELLTKKLISEGRDPRLAIRIVSGPARQESFNKSKEQVAKLLQDKQVESPSRRRRAVARLGGIERGHSFKVTKNEFEELFQRDVVPFASPTRFRGESPAGKPKLSLNGESKRVLTSSKSETFVAVASLNDDDSDDSEQTHVRRLRFKQDRFGGLRRKTSFRRSKRALAKKLNLKLQTELNEKAEQDEATKKTSTKEDRKARSESPQSRAIRRPSLPKRSKSGSWSQSLTRSRSRRQCHSQNTEADSMVRT